MKFLSLLLFSILILTSCNPEEKDPAFLYIDQYSFNTGPGEGTSSEKITEVWVYVNDQVVGITDLPARIPIIETGAATIGIFPGIKNNGLSSMRIKYPFYQGYTFSKTLQPLQVDTVVPSFSYFDDLLIVEKNYDGTSPSAVGLTNNQAELLIADDPAIAFEGERCGHYKLAAGNSLLAFKDDQNLTFNSGEVIFLEMNYSSNSKFSIGLIGREGTTDKKHLAVVVNPTTDGTLAPVWNKIYIDLGLIVSQNPNASYFEVYFESTPDTAGEPVNLYLDNLKLVRFS